MRLDKSVSDHACLCTNRVPTTVSCGFSPIAEARCIGEDCDGEPAELADLNLIIGELARENRIRIAC